MAKTTKVQTEDTEKVEDSEVPEVGDDEDDDDLDDDGETGTAEGDDAPKKRGRKKMLQTEWTVEHNYTTSEGTEVKKEVKVKGPISRAVRRSKKFLNAKADFGDSFIKASDPTVTDATAEVEKKTGADAEKVEPEKEDQEAA